MNWTYMCDGMGLDWYLWQTYYNSTAESGANNILLWDPLSANEEADNKILIVQRVYNWTRVMFKGSKEAHQPFFLSLFLRHKSWRSNTIAAHNIMSVRKTWVYKIPQSKTKPKDENVRISSVHYCARGSHLEGHLWVILKFAQNVTSSNQNHHYRTKMMRQ